MHHKKYIFLSTILINKYSWTITVRQFHITWNKDEKKIVIALDINKELYSLFIYTFYLFEFYFIYVVDVCILYIRFILSINELWSRKEKKKVNWQVNGNNCQSLTVSLPLKNVLSVVELGPLHHPHGFPTLSDSVLSWPTGP